MMYVVCLYSGTQISRHRKLRVALVAAQRASQQDPYRNYYVCTEEGTELAVWRNGMQQ